MPPSIYREKWRQYQILYDGLNYQTKTLLETICKGDSFKKMKNQGWELFEDLAEKTIQWEPTLDKSRNSNPVSSKGDLHSIESSIAVEAKIASLMRRLEALKLKNRF